MSKLIQLSITPIDQHNAHLIGIVGDIDAKSIFSQIAKYEGYNYYQTPEDVYITTAEYDNKTYKITSIKNCVFSHCRDIKNIHIGATVVSIEWNMYQCSSLMNIFVDSENRVYHDNNGVLFKGSELIAFPQGRKGHYDVPNGTTKIGNHAFKSCYISSISFPDSLMEIGINSFYECRNINEFILPDSIRKVCRNDDRDYRPISQKFYLKSDVHKENPLSIADVTKLFPS